MIRIWTGLAFLACSWIFGMGYYHAPNWPIHVAFVLVGAGLFAHHDRRIPNRSHALAAALLLAPAVLILPPPFKSSAIILLIGSLLLAFPRKRTDIIALGRGLACSGVILLVQGQFLMAYRHLTARSHELPSLLASALEKTALLMGINASYSGRDIALYSMRKVHLLAATWEFLIDPLTLCFLAGGLTAIFLLRPSRKAFAMFTLSVAVWLPLRAALLLATFLHRNLLTDYDSELKLMNQFWNPWTLSLLLIGPVLLASKLVRATPSTPEVADIPSGFPDRPTRKALLLGGLSVCMITIGLFVNPVGLRKAGRVMVDEFHSSWEPTQRPFDTTWYGHEAGYNYACIYDYASRFYEMSRLTNRIDDAALRNCDVMILKVPTSSYAPEEVRALVGFVERGGGLMLVGEHTDVFYTSTHLNQVARMFGFEFRDDCLFGIDSPFQQRYEPPTIPDPILQHVPPIDFAVSCSIAPAISLGRAVILSTGLWSLPADYHASNFYPQVEERAEARYGAFVQLWSARYGSGRVVAFSDSTIFSNFSAFEPGKSELMLGMIECLNHTNIPYDPRPWMLIFGLIVGVGALHGLSKSRVESVLPVAVGLLGWVLATGAVRFYHSQAMPFPKAGSDLTMITIDRTVSDAPLSKCGFIKATPQSFGIFEQWILRLGWFLSRQQGEEVFEGDLAVFFHPNKPVNEPFRSKVKDYVETGGKVLIIDSAINEASTANELLLPFGVSLDSGSNLSGTLEAPEGWPVVPADSVKTVAGGAEFASMNGESVATVLRHGKGLVVVVGFGARFNDDNMGITTDMEPDDALMDVYQLEFNLLRAIIGNTLP